MNDAMQKNADTDTATVTNTAAWRRLDALRHGIAATTLATLFAADGERAKALSWAFDGLWLDLTRQRLTTDIKAALVELADAMGVWTRRRALFAGEAVNTTENRAALHPALRDDGSLTPAAFAETARAQRDRFLAFAEDVRQGRATGSTGERFTDVIAIGIGGSHRGPEVVATALARADAPIHTSVRVRFVANVDGADLAGALAGLTPASTLFVIASKSFTTAETMLNAASARAWIVAALGPDAVAGHFAAVTTAPERAGAFAIAPARVFAFEDWVGGRFSLWSSVGLSAAIAIGAEAFGELLAGAHAMDRHFIEAEAGENLPVMLALADFWNRNFLKLPARAVLPYDERLSALPAHLQQVEMESNGKGVTVAGDAVGTSPAALVFGMTGTNGQHTFHQMLHQGPALAAAEFIGVAEAGHDLPGHHDVLLANMLAQAEALALGSGDGPVERHCPGNRPSTVLLVRRLDPYHLGLLLALYEHKVFVEGVLAGVNSFDQFGVEFGKSLAGPLVRTLESGADGVPAAAGEVSAAAVTQLRAWRR